MPDTQLPSEQQPSSSSSDFYGTPLIPVENRNMLIFLALLIVGGVLGFLYAKQQSLERQTVTVVGNATLPVQADQAIITASTETIDKTHESTVESSKIEIEKIQAALFNLGLPERNFTIKQSYEPSPYYPDDDFPQFGIASQSGQNYSALTIFEVILEQKEVKALDQYLSILKTYNTSPTVTYALTDRKPYDIEIKQKAIENARQQAETLAKNNRLTVARLVSVVDRPTQADGKAPTEEKAAAQEKQMTFTASYEVTYELENKLFPF